MRQLGLIGVDVSDSSIKVLQLDEENKIVAYGNEALKEGIVVHGHIADTTAFGDALTAILKNTKPKVLYSEQTLLRSVLCLPESKLFTHFVVLPTAIKKSDIASFVKNDAEKIIPYDLGDFYWDYSVGEKGGKLYATFTGAPKSVIDNYVTAFSHTDIKLTFIGSELFSLGKALLPDALDDDGGYMILDIGAHTTDIGVFLIDAVANMSVTVPLGGTHITDAIAHALGITVTEAEKLKCEQGLVASSKNSVREIIIECLKEVLHTVAQTRTFFEEKCEQPIKHIILAGGSAQLRELTTYFTEATGITTVLAEPLAKIQDREILGGNKPEVYFANVIGLALLGKDMRKAGINLLTQYRYSDDDTEKIGLSLRDIRTFSDLKYVAYSLVHILWGHIILRIGVIQRVVPSIHIRLVLSILSVLLAGAFLVWVIASYT